MIVDRASLDNGMFGRDGNCRNEEDGSADGYKWWQHCRRQEIWTISQWHWNERRHSHEGRRYCGYSNHFCCKRMALEYVSRQRSNTKYKMILNCFPCLAKSTNKDSPLIRGPLLEGQTIFSYILYINAGKNRSFWRNRLLHWASVVRSYIFIKLGLFKWWK